MNLLAATNSGNAIGQLAAAVILGVVAIHALLPRPKGRSIALGVFAGIAAVVVIVSWIVRQFGQPSQGQVSLVLFWLFSGGAVLFSTIFIAQRNPARGAIAFAFVIVNVCGLFLLLAAPFLMAATIVIYAGAIIVTFLFVLMLSNAIGTSNENDRSREPLLGSLAGFSFLGLVLFALYQGSPTAAADALKSEYHLPAVTMTSTERTTLLTLAEHAGVVSIAATREEMLKTADGLRESYADLLGTSDSFTDELDLARTNRTMGERMAVRSDVQADAIKAQNLNLKRAVRKALNGLDNLSMKPEATAAEFKESTEDFAKLREETILLAARGELPARNVANLGYALYTDYLLAVEMAGTVLLIATIGAVSIAGRKEAMA